METTENEIQELPDGVSIWKMPKYDVVIIKERTNIGSSIIFCRSGWDYRETRDNLKTVIPAWNTAFKFSEKEDFTFLPLDHGKSVSGNGIRFTNIDRTNKDFFSDLIEPLAQNHYIPEESADWFKNYEPD